MSIVKNSFIYLGSSILSKVAPFLLLPFLTSYLSKKEFGVLATYLVINNLYSVFIGLSLHTNVTRNFYKKTKNELAIVIGNVFLILFSSTFLYFIFTIIAVQIWGVIFSIPSKYFLLSPFLALLSMINQIFLSILRNEGKAYLFGIFELSNAFITSLATYILLVNFNFGWTSQVTSLVIANSVFALISFAHILKSGYINLSYNKSYISKILKLSVPLVPHLLGGSIIAVSDRLFIERMVGIEAVALYSVGYSFGSVVSLLTDAIIKAWSPWFYEKLAQPTHEKKIKIVKATYLYILFIFICAFLISLIAEIILPYMVHEDFQNATQYVRWVAIGYAVQGVYKIFFPYLVHISKTMFLALSTILAATINLVLNYFLILRYGPMGAVYATVVAYSLSAVLVFWYQRKHYFMPWRLESAPLD